MKSLTQAKAYLDGFSSLEGLLRWNSHLSLPQQLLCEVGNVTACNGDVLYAAANHVAFCLKHGNTTKQFTFTNQSHLRIAYQPNLSLLRRYSKSKMFILSDVCASVRERLTTGMT